MLSWNDQPECLLDSKRLCRFFLQSVGVSVEVRRKVNEYYVTTGNLFGSQTVRCPNSDTVFSLIEKLNKLKEGELVTLPAVCDVVPNRKPELVEN